MKFGARNNLQAEVIEIQEGSVMCQIKLKLVNSDHQVSSVMTMDSLKEMGLSKGETVSVVVKAVNVMLAKD